jgi:hypothetical protein
MPTSSNWGDRCLVLSPVYYTVVIGEKQFKRQLKRLNVKIDEPAVKNQDSARIWHFETPEGRACSIICFPESTVDKCPNSVVALLVHEITHLKQRIFELLGEDKPSHEFEAYVMQSLTQEALSMYSVSARKFNKSKVKKSNR